MNFYNKENRCYNVDGKEIWHSRSVAVVGMVLMLHEGERYVIIGKRGPAVGNAVGKWCMPCGYLDWNESLEDAVTREVWEESGFNIYKSLNNFEVLHDHLHFPWRIDSNPESELQNVSLHYAVYFNNNHLYDEGPARLPELTIKNNPVKNEVTEVKWVKVDDLIDYDMAFNHNNIIGLFVKSLPPEV